MSERIRRALLFMPGDSQKKIEKSATLNVDSVIMDLEDGVALNRKDEARAVIASALQNIAFGRSERLVRINPADSGLEHDDLNAVLRAHPDGIVLPKVESARQVQAISTAIQHYEGAAGIPDGTIRLLALIETARGIVNLREIADSDARLDALMFGAEDLAGSIGAIRTREGSEVAYARSAVVIHAAAFALDAIDTVFIDLEALDDLRTESESAARMGYTGKMAIHPRQVEPITAAFTPAESAVQAAEQLIGAWEAHQASGAGVFALDGKMVDTPMLRAAEKVIARARAAGMRQ